MFVTDNTNVPYIIDRSETSDGGYIEWSNGYKEAWDQYHKGSNLYNTDLITVNLPISITKPNNAYVNTNIIGRQGTGSANINIDSINTNSIVLASDGSTSGTLSAKSFTWVVKGF